MASLNNIGGLHYEMMRRCYNENSVAYKDYGAKSIKVCEEWHDREVFRKWCIDNGLQKGLKIKRKRYRACAQHVVLRRIMLRNIVGVPEWVNPICLMAPGYVMQSAGRLGSSAKTNFSLVFRPWQG